MAIAATDVTQDDPIETLYERGVTDGLPVVPPTRQRVERMLAGAPWRRRDELIGLLGPQMGRATVEKVAINTVGRLQVRIFSCRAGRCRRAMRHRPVRAWA